MIFQDLYTDLNSNDIKSSTLDFIDIFKDNNKFIVNEFQRKYDWNKEILINLLIDLEQFQDDQPYFLGTLIFKIKKNNEYSKYSEFFSIVDGQQRITSLFLILKFIELNLNDKSIISEIQNFYSYKSDNCNDKNLERLKIVELHGEEELKNILLNNANNMNLKKNNFNFYNIFLEIKKHFKKNKIDLHKFYSKIKKN